REIGTPAAIHPGDIISYNIQVSNDGPGKAAHVTLDTQTPPHTTFVSLSAPPGWVVYQKPTLNSTGAVTSSVYALPSGSTAVFHLNVRVSFLVQPGTLIGHSSTVSSFMPDPITSNNTTTRTIIVQ